MSESAPGFASILDGGAAPAAARWDIPNFDSLARPKTPPPTAAEIESIEAQAFREGQARGFAEGLKQGRLAAQAEVLRLREALAHLQQPIADVDAETERALVALMLELARRLVQQELATDPSKMVAIVRDAVSHLSQPVRAVRIRLHPEDAKVVSEHLEPLEPGEEWRVIADKTLMPGDCIVDTESARVDARLDTRQSMLASRILGDAV